MQRRQTQDNTPPPPHTEGEWFHMWCPQTAALSIPPTESSPVLFPACVLVTFQFHKQYCVLFKLTHFPLVQFFVFILYFSFITFTECISLFPFCKCNPVNVLLVGLIKDFLIYTHTQKGKTNRHVYTCRHLLNIKNMLNYKLQLTSLFNTFCVFVFFFSKKSREQTAQLSR